ncbi:MAG: hypothetical protein ACFNYJ_08190, partial [Segatella oris]
SYDVKDTLQSVDLEEASVLNRETALEEMFYDTFTYTIMGPLQNSSYNLSSLNIFCTFIV